MKIALFHGWGFDRSIWDAVIPLLPGHDCEADNRGYFGTPATAGPADLAVTHSLGTLRALAAPPAGCRALLALNGFDRFAAGADFPAGVPLRVIDRMLARLDAAPAAVVGTFRETCGADAGPPIADPARLHADLALLRDGDGRGCWAGPLVLLEGAEDPIVSAGHRAACFADRPDARRHVLPGHGHLLPLTAPEACARAIAALAESLR
ncbi:alpha/beta fold hydrolase [Novosphingobium bradum]|uniref:Alpha/beta fold hydrolase n=1 Tax=Novosphingobium bradum TaxID=1737444 RepID=A0ABV7IUF9_9SPHN